jgi:oxalate decarboxylase
MEPQHFPGGTLKLVTADDFPMSNTMCGALMTLQPSALRELHWHPNVDEWQYVIAGKLSVGLFGSGGRYRIEELREGDSAYVPSGYGHHIENIGDSEAKILFGFNSGYHHSVSASEWFGKNSTQLLATNFGVPESTFGKIILGNKFIRARQLP